MNIHQITLQGYTASVVPSTDPTSNCVSGLYLGTAGSYGVEQLDVTQSTGWENLSVTAIFQPCGVKITVPAEGGTIDVPWEATADMLTYPQGRSVFQGYADGELVYSCDLPYTVSGHSATTGTDPQPPTPDQYQQFVQEVQASADAAANSATAAAGSATAAASSAQQAADVLQQVKEAGQQAAEAIETAQTNAVQAVGGAQSAAVQAVQDAQSTGVQAVQGQQQTSVGAVQAAGTAAVSQVNQTGQQQVQAVKNEGTTQTNAVAEAGSTQVYAVQQAGSQQITNIGEAGAQQVQAVNTAGDNKLDQINTAITHPPQPNTSTGFWQVWNAETGQYEDTTALYQGGYYTPSVAADGTLTWIGSQSGMPELPSTNISGPQGLGVPTPSASNIGQVPTVNTAGDGYLLTGPYAPLDASIRPTANGNPAVCEDSVAWSFQGLKIYGKSTQTSSQLLPLTESSYSANGLTATLQDDGSLIVNGTPGSSFTNLICIPLSLSPGDYYIAGGENTSGHVVAFNEIKKSTGTNYFANQSFAVDGTETSIVFMLQSNFADAIDNYRVAAMLNKGTEPLPVQSYTPTSESPVPILNTGDGGSVESTITNGNICPTSSGTTNFQTDCFVLAGVQYTICAKQSALVGFRIQIRDADNSAIESIAIYDNNTTWKDSGYAAFTPTKSGKVFINSFAQCEWSEVAIYVGALTARQYDAYQSQSFSISTPNGLPGVPVSSGSNCTDSTGQAFTSDYWDFADGLQHILCGQIASYNGEEITTPYISSTGDLTTGAQVVYVLPEPQTQPIPAETLAAYHALTTYANTTVISTAEPVATMEATVYCDAGATIQRLQGEIQTLSDATALNTQTLNTMLGAE